MGMLGITDQVAQLSVPITQTCERTSPSSSLNDCIGKDENKLVLSDGGGMVRV